MRLDGIHHVTCITGDVIRNAEFYVGVLGLRLVGKSVNQDDPLVYHVFYSDESGDPGADITFFEYRHAMRGRAGAGTIYRVVWRVASADALVFWEKRLAAHGVRATRDGDHLLFADPEGLQHELIVDRSGDRPLIAEHPEIPAELALRGFEGVRAYARESERSRAVLERVMNGRALDALTWEMRGEKRGGWIAYDPAPSAPAQPGAGSVHHVAWGTSLAEHPAWLDRLQHLRVRSTEIVDRYYFQSIYFHEPNGILFEIASDGPGFARDGSVEELGRKIILPPWYESRRKEIEAQLTPIPDLRANWARKA